MIPVHSLPGPPQEVGAAWPEAVHGVFLEVLLAMAKSGTPVWWNAAIAVAVAAIAVAAVVLVLRRAPVLGVTPNRARADIVGGLVAWGAAIVVSNEPRDLGVVETSFLVATFVVALALGAAGAVSRARTALVLSVGVLAVDALVHAAFDRDGGAPGGWGVASGGAQVSATTGSAIAIAAAPLAGWAVAAAWAALPIHEPRRKAAAVTT